MENLKLKEIIETISEPSALVVIADLISQSNLPGSRKWSNEILQQAVQNAEDTEERIFALNSYVEGDFFINSNLTKFIYNLAIQNACSVEEEINILEVVGRDDKINDTYWLKSLINGLYEKLENDEQRTDLLIVICTSEMLGNDLWKQNILINILKMIDSALELAFVANCINSQECSENKIFLTDIFETVVGTDPAYYFENFMPGTDLINFAAYALPTRQLQNNTHSGSIPERMGKTAF